MLALPVVFLPMKTFASFSAMRQIKAVHILYPKNSSLGYCDSNITNADNGKGID